MKHTTTIVLFSAVALSSLPLPLDQPGAAVLCGGGSSGISGVRTADHNHQCRLQPLPDLAATVYIRSRLNRSRSNQQSRHAPEL